MRKLYVILVLALSLVACSAQGGGKKTFIVGFYNLENLFDTYDDPVKNDQDFLPDGSYQWTEAKYQKKLHNIAKVISSMAETNGRFHTILGVSEVENRLVLEDLVAQPEIADVNYQIVHYDSPDNRGIDVALLYNPGNFTLLDSEAIPYTFDSETIEFDMDEASQKRFRTRDVLMVHGLLDGEQFAVYVAHLPSRIGGKGSDLRSRGAEIIYNHAMGMMEKYPGIKIAVMGDMNDNPTDESMVTYMRGKETPAEVGETDFFSPFLSMLKAGYGSLAYQGTWNIYDIILVNEPLLNGGSSSLRIRPTGNADGKKAKKSGKEGNYGVVYRQDWMIQQSGQYKGTPFRTFSNGAFINGFSDHLPTYIVLEK